MAAKARFSLRNILKISLTEKEAQKGIMKID
jgi:hypothetical protein